jgi:hypothetical protein
MKKVKFILATVLVIILPSLSYADSIVLYPAKDNTIYHNEGKTATDSLSNGKGVNFVAGSVNTIYCYRRALIRFDMPDIVPANIDSVVLKIHAQQNAQQDATERYFSLHRVTNEWDEGFSNADDAPGKGAPAQTNDATWKWRKYTSNTWANPGGDYVSAMSARTNTLGYLWDTDVYWCSGQSGNEQMKQDVKDWISGAENNYGWIIIGIETDELCKATMFYSRESSYKPTLTIYY